MADKLAFALEQYALLGVFMTAALGLGRPFAGRVPDPLLRIPFQISAGMGAMMVLLFIAGALGQLNAPVIIVVILLGVGFALAPLLRLSQRVSVIESVAAVLRQVSIGVWWWITLVAIAGLPLLLAPLQPPSEWDELMYHLPYARFWAEQGGLMVNQWLRYPLSAYNMNLVYAACLVFGNDILPHLLHALAAGLTAVLTFAIARRFMDWRVGLIAAVLLLYTTRWGWGNAYVDLGVMLFWSAAFAALALRPGHDESRFVYLAACFAGIAVGIKYQGLFYLPVFGVLALIVERRPAVLARAALIFVAVGGYWYLRNYLISGDPVHPIGGKLFGFWLWNANDLAYQYADLEQARTWPSWLFLPALAGPLFWRGSSPFLRGLILSATGSVAIWYLVSGYWRYLVPVHAMLALLSAFVIVEIWSRLHLATFLGSPLRRVGFRFRWAFAFMGLAAIALTVADDASKAWHRVLPDEDDREAFLAERFAGYSLLRSLGEPAVGNLYQLGFEDQIYYLGDSVRGDWFGPGRYSAVIALASDPRALARYLNDSGVDSLLLKPAQKPFSSLLRDPAFADRFELVGRSDDAALYRLRSDSMAGPGGEVVTPPSERGSDQ